MKALLVAVLQNKMLYLILNSKKYKNRVMLNIDFNIVFVDLHLFLFYSKNTTVHITKKMFMKDSKKSRF